MIDGFSKSLAVLLILVSVTASGVADITRGNPAARLLPGEFASEHWEFTARFDSGHLLFAEFLITNIGLGDRNAAAVWHIVPPDGHPRRSTNGRREGHWQLSADRLRLEVGSSLLDLHEPVYRLRLHKRSARIDLRFRRDGPALWSEHFTPYGYALDLLGAAIPVDGVLWIKGMAESVAVRGTLAATRSWMSAAGSSIMLRRVEFFALDRDFPLYSVDLTTPKGQRVRWVVLTPNGTRAYESHQFDVVLDDTVKESQERGYEVPGTLYFRNSEIEGKVQLERVVWRGDPFADLPQPFRYLVELALDLRPRRMWARSSFTVCSFLAFATANHPPVRAQGTGVTAVTFLNPLALSQSQTAAQTGEGSGAYRCPDQPASGL
jgi:hypothetical protein